MYTPSDYTQLSQDCAALSLADLGLADLEPLGPLPGGGLMIILLLLVL